MKACKFLSLLLASLMLLSCLVVLPTAAEEETKAPTVVWEFDVESIENGTQDKETDQYLLDTMNNPVTEVDGSKCFSVNHNILTIRDKSNDLVRQTAFYVDFDIKFDSFPSGMHDATYTVDEYPMALFTWIVHKEDGKNPNYNRSIRIDSKGNLYYTRNTGHSLNASLKLGTWNTFRFAITPETGGFEINLNGERIFYKNYDPVNDKSVAGSYFRFFEMLDFQAYLKNIKVRSMDTVLGINQEPSADYLGYQTTAIRDDGTFDIRFVSSLAEMNTNTVGYQIISIVTDSNGEVIEDCKEVESHLVYDKVMADGKAVTASSLETGYLTLCTLKDVDADSKNAIFVIRPYILGDDMRVYGETNILYYEGKTENGYPVLSPKSAAASNEIAASDDTYVRDQNGVNFGKSDVMQIKNGSSGYTRHMYIKFDIPEKSVDTLLASECINLRLKLKGVRSAVSADEKQNGGVLVNVFATSTDWDEETLVYENFESVETIKQIDSLRLSGSGYIFYDVTDYLHEALNDGETTISLRFENAVPDGSAGETVFFSKESSSDAAPVLMIDAPVFNHNLDNLQKIHNYGYEPWGYAEKIVREWIDETYDKIYSADDNRDVFELETLDTTKPVGANTVLVEGKNSPNPPSNPFLKYYARTIDSLIEKGGFVEDTANFSQYDEFGGITNSGIKGEATGFFHTEMIGGRAYLINPLGNPTYIVGLGQMQLGQTDNHKAVSIEKYGSEEEFWESITKELKDKAGVNMSNGAVAQATATSTPMLAVGGLSGIQSYMSKLGLVVSEGIAPVYKYDDILNVFDPDFLPYVMETNKTTLENNADNIYLLGYTSDNELTSEEKLLDKYLSTASDAYCNAFSYAVAWTFLAERTEKINPSLADITPELRKEFKSLVFSKILGAVRQSIDTYAPNHLYLGNRTNAGNKSSEAYLRVAGYYCDMLSINMYDGIQPSVATMADIYRYSGKPFFVTEFYSKADDAIDMNGQKLGNQQNAGFHVKNQQARADYYENYTTLLLECKYCVGWTWFTFRDNDQSLYYPSQSDTSKILRVWQKGQNKDIVSFIDQDGNVVKATGNEYRFYTGCDFDMSSIGSNKGLLDNRLNFYPELTESFKRISDNFINLTRYFDNLHK